MTFSPRVWSDALRRLQQELPDFAYDAWIAPLKAKTAEGDDRIILGCPNAFHRDRIRLRHLDAIQQAVQHAIADAVDASGSAGGMTDPAHAAPRTLESPIGLGPDGFETADISDTSEPDRPAGARLGAQVTIELLTASEFAAVAGRPLEARVGMQRVGVVGQAKVVNGQPAPSRGATPSARPLRERDRDPDLSPADRAHTHGANDPAENPTENHADTTPKRGARRVEAKGQPAVQTRVGPQAGSGSAGNGEATNSTDPRFALDGQPGPRGPRTRDAAYTFDAFVVGPCNSLAREATLALARGRQASLNLLYLAADSGMGKTHLAKAAVLEARFQAAALVPDGRGGSAFDPAPGLVRGGAKSTRTRVIYTTAEQFTSDFVSAMRNGQNDAWKTRFRGPIELLVVEDVQILRGRGKTQLELFHTIAHVLEAGGRVLLTGDRSPRFLSGLDDRLKAQMGQGFVAEIDRPDPIVRRHILRTKSAAAGVHLPPECLDRLVEVTGDSSGLAGNGSGALGEDGLPQPGRAHGARGASVTDIESLLIQIVTTSSLLGRPVDAALVQEAIDVKAGAAGPLAPRTLEVPEIVKAVAVFFQTRPETLASRSRRRDVLVPRQLAMYLADRYTNASYTEIGRALGRDHPSVANAIKKIEREIFEKAPVRYQVEALCDKIDGLLQAGAERS